MDINLLFSIFGLAGGLLCCVGDIFFDLKGPGNKKLGTSKKYRQQLAKNGRVEI